eukprot:1279913-Karenia_brevis.AAC.1
MAVEVTGNVGPQSQQDPAFTGFMAPPQVHQVDLPDNPETFLAIRSLGSRCRQAMPTSTASLNSSKGLT